MACEFMGLGSLDVSCGHFDGKMGDCMGPEHLASSHLSFFGNRPAGGKDGAGAGESKRDRAMQKEI